MKDGAVRRTLKAVARGAFFLNVWADRGWRRVRGERTFLLGGACQRCAACCEAPAIRVPALIWLAPLLRRAFLWSQDRVNGFELVEARRRERTFVLSCTHFDRATRACDSYASRPGMCRDYFNGVDQYVDVPDHDEMDFGTGDFSVDGWIRTTVNSGTRVVLDKRQPAPDLRGYSVYVYNGNLGVELWFERLRFEDGHRCRR